MTNSAQTITRKINQYQRDYRHRHGCPDCRAKITTRMKFANDPETGDQKFKGTYDACVNYKGGSGDGTCSFYISNVDKPTMREVAVGEEAPSGPRAAFADPRAQIIRRAKPETKKIDLTKIHTKQLLNGLRAARADQSRAVENGYLGDEIPENVDKSLLGFKPIDNVIEPTIAEVKAELATREHVPNKQEAKKIRQERAKRKR